MALIQGIKNANKTGVRFGWCANGGFLEGAGAGAIRPLSACFQPSAALVNMVPIWGSGLL